MPVIRAEKPEDVPDISRILQDAFAHHPYSDGSEHSMVDALRADNALVLSLVAEEHGEVRGHIAFSAASIGSDSQGWYCLGPVAVAPPYQNRGLGAHLIHAGLEKLRTCGALGLVLIGPAQYYARFGFVPIPEVTVAGVPPEFVLTLCFGTVRPLGEVRFHKAYGAVGA